METTANLHEIDSESIQAPVEGFIPPVAGADVPYADLNARRSTWDSFQCLISHSIARGHVLEM